MQKKQLFRDLTKLGNISSLCPLKYDDHLEHNLIKKMTSSDPNLRPTALEIENKWLPLIFFQIFGLNINLSKFEAISDEISVFLKNLYQDYAKTNNL